MTATESIRGRRLDAWERCGAIRPGHSLAHMPFPLEFWNHPFATGSVAVAGGAVVFTDDAGISTTLHNHAVPEILDTIAAAGDSGWLYGSDLLWSPDLDHLETSDPWWWPTASRRVWWVLTEPPDECGPRPMTPERRDELGDLGDRSMHLRYLQPPLVERRPWLRLRPPPASGGPAAALPEWVVVWNVHCGGVAPGGRDRKIMGGNWRFKQRLDPTDECSVWSSAVLPPGIARPGTRQASQGGMSVMSLHIAGVLRHGWIVVPPPGRDTTGRLRDLRAAADAAAAAGETRWWAPAWVKTWARRPRVGVLFSDRDAAASAARLAGAETLLEVEAARLTNAPPSADNVTVTDLDGNRLAGGYRLATTNALARHPVEGLAQPIPS